MKDHKQTHSATDLLIVCTCVNNRIIVVWVPCSWCCKGAAIDCIAQDVVRVISNITQAVFQTQEMKLKQHSLQID